MQFDIYAFSISAEQVTAYFNYGFYAFVAIGLLGFLIGLIKGLWKKSFSFVFYLILFTLLICFIKPISNFVYNFDVQKITTLFNVQLGQELNNFHTIGEYLQITLEEMIKSSNIAIEFTPETKYAIDGLALSIVQLALFIVGNILIWIFGFFVCPLLYHLFFKWFVPKRVRKNHKFRFFGGLVGLVEYVCIFSLFLSPFTAVINTALNSVKDENGNININDKNDDEIYNLITNLLEGYNNSILANSIFKITLNGKSLDVILMDYITDSNLSEDQKLHLFDELQNIFSVAYDAISQGVINLSSGAIYLPVLFDTQVVKDMLYSLSNSTLVCFTLPIAVTLGLSLTDDSLNMDLSNIDLSNINWSDSIKGVGDIFESIRETGIINANNIKNPNEILNTVYINRDNETSLKNAVRRLGDSSLFNKLMPQIFVAYLNSVKPQKNDTVSLKAINNKETSNQDNSLSLTNIELPDEAYEVETYASINWGEEFSNLLEIVFKMSDQYRAIDSNDLSISQIGTLFTQENLMKLFFGISNDKKFITEDDYANNIYINGGNVSEDVTIPGTKAILGTLEDENNVGLLDLQIVKKLFVDFKVFPKLLPNIMSTLEGMANIELDEVTTTIEEEIADWDISNWKNEMAAIIESATPLLNLTKIISNNSADSNQMISSLSEGEGNVALIYTSRKVEDSFVLNKVAPLALEAFTSIEKNDVNLFLGIKLSDLNFTSFDEEASFASEIYNIASNVLPSVSKFMEIIEDGTNLDDIIKEKESLVSILEGVYNSQIFNRHLSKEEIANNISTNFEKVMIQIFSNPTSEDLENGFDTSFNIPNITNDLVMVDKEVIKNVGKNGNRDWVEPNGDGEIRAIFNVISSLKSDREGETNYLFEMIENGGTIGDNVYDMGDEIARIFATIDHSQIMKKALPYTMNKLFEDNELISSSIDFNLVENWESEGESLKLTLESIKEIKESSSGDSEDLIDILMNSDKNLIPEYQFSLEKNSETYNKYDGKYYKYFEAESKSYKLLKNIEETQSIDLPNLLYLSVENLLTSSSLINQEDIEASEGDFNFEDNEIIYNQKYKVSWKLNDSEEYRGEIYNFARIFAVSYNIENLTSGELEALAFDEMLNLLNNSYPFRTLLGDVIENAFKEVSADVDTSMTSFLNNVDYSAFERSEYNYSSTDDINNRSDEIEKRSYDISAISEFYKNKTNLENITGNNYDEIIKSMTEGGENSNFVILLNKMHDSELFNSTDYINKIDSTTNERNQLTAFESFFVDIFNSNSDIFEEIRNEEIYGFNNKTNDDWIGETGEILRFSEALNYALNSALFNELKSEEMSLDSLKTLYSGKETHLEDLSDSLASSRLLKMQLPHIYDDFIYSEIKENLPKYDESNKQSIDEDYYLFDRPYKEYNKSYQINWSNEGSSIDSLINEISISGVELSKPSDIKSTTLDNLLNSLKNSQVLNYEKRLTEYDNERNTYEYLISCTDSVIKYKIYNEDNVFEINDPLKQVEYITTKDVVDFENEQKVLVSLVAGYDTLSEKYFESGGLKDINSLNSDELDDINGILNGILSSLRQSQMFNFRNKDSEEYFIKGETYLNRTTYEYGVIFIANKIKEALVDGFELNEGQGYVIDNDASNYLKDLTSFETEQAKLLNIVDVFKNLNNLLNEDEGLSLQSISENKETISDLFTSISESLILNNTIEVKYDNPYTSENENNYLSIYDDLVIYLINRINTSIHDSLSYELANSNISISNIKNNKVISTQDDFVNEINYVLEGDGIIDLVNKLGVENEGFTLNIDFIKDLDNQINIKKLLEKFNSSKAFNYYSNEISASEFDKTISTFEKMLLRIFYQDSFEGKIYDENNDRQRDNLESRYEAEASYNDQLVVLDKIVELNRNEQDEYSKNLFLFTKTNESKDGEIDKLFALFENLDNEYLDFENFDNATDLLYEIGEIYILHDIEPKLIRDISEKQEIGTSGINSISDLTISNSPDYYYYEDENNYNEFISCSEAYKDELDNIVILIDKVKLSNVSGNISEKENLNIFGPLLEKMEPSNIYRPIALDTVVTILSQLGFTYQAYSIDYGLDFFIGNNSYPGKDYELEESLQLVENNFDTFKELTRNDLYIKEGQSLDAFLTYVKLFANGENEPNVVIDSEYPDLIGYKMITNFDDVIGSIFSLYQ